MTTASEIRASDAAGLKALMTRKRWVEVARIVVTGLIALLYWQALVPVQVLWVAIAIGLYPLVKTGILDLIHERKVGTEIFVTSATLVAVFGGETVAGAVLMVIILIAEFIAELNTDRARASIKSLIGSVPQVALSAFGSSPGQGGCRCGDEARHRRTRAPRLRTVAGPGRESDGGRPGRAGRQCSAPARERGHRGLPSTTAARRCMSQSMDDLPAASTSPTCCARAQRKRWRN